MPVPTSITDLSTTASSNYPGGTDSVAANTGPDDYFRAHASIIRRLQAKGANVASAATVDLGAIADGSYVHITGTTGITSFGTVAAGVSRTVVFDGALTITHNATSMILPGAANITTAAGDVAEFVSEGSGNWRCKTYQTGGLGSVWVGTSNGYGSTNTAIRRFLTTYLLSGTDITYADSEANGASFTINTTGIYSISYTDSFNEAHDLGVSLNSTQLTTLVVSITAANRLTMCTTAAGSYRNNCSVTVPLTAGDVIRPHAGAPGGGTAPTNAHFTISRVA